jgi:hypothetical protein
LLFAACTGPAACCAACDYGFSAFSFLLLLMRDVDNQQRRLDRQPWRLAGGGAAPTAREPCAAERRHEGGLEVWALAATLIRSQLYEKSLSAAVALSLSRCTTVRERLYMVGRPGARCWREAQLLCGFRAGTIGKYERAATQFILSR